MLLTAFSLKAQQESIFFMDFEPDTMLHIGYPPNEICIDFDNDDLPDIKLYWYQESPGAFVELVCRDANVKMCLAEEGDTISHLTEWRTGTPYPHIHENYAIRIEKEGLYYYGWFRIYSILAQYKLFFDKFAFCTIPDYPLVWGQTDIVGIDENDESIPFAALYPNPTNGLVTITGENLRQAEVINMLGQKLLGVKGKGGELHVDMAALPVGRLFRQHHRRGRTEVCAQGGEGVMRGIANPHFNAGGLQIRRNGGCGCLLERSLGIHRQRKPQSCRHVGDNGIYPARR